MSTKAQVNPNQVGTLKCTQNTEKNTHLPHRSSNNKEGRGSRRALRLAWKGEVRAGSGQCQGRAKGNGLEETEHTLFPNDILA